MKKETRNVTCPINFHWHHLKTLSGLGSSMVSLYLWRLLQFLCPFTCEIIIYKIFSGTKPLLVGTLRQTLMHLEANIVLQFMHPNWTLLRKPWVQAVQSCQVPRDFSRALCVLQVCTIKPGYIFFYYKV